MVFHTIKCDDDGYVWNLAYGANMNLKALTNRRKIKYVFGCIWCDGVWFVDGRSLVYGDISIDSTGLVNIDIHNVLILL